MRFICLLLSSCEDITTECEDCHAGVPQCQVCDYGDFVDGECLTTTVTSPATETTTTALAEDFGILVIGGQTSSSASYSVELFSPAAPEEGSCLQEDYPRNMILGPTANFATG